MAGTTTTWPRRRPGHPRTTQEEHSHGRHGHDVGYATDADEPTHRTRRNPSLEEGEIGLTVHGGLLPIKPGSGSSGVFYTPCGGGGADDEVAAGSR
jgi:hypothetical protein